MPLYVLTAETMAINIRSNSLIHGVRPPTSKNEVKLSQFADYTTLLLTDEQSIIETLNSPPLPRLTKVNVKDCGAVISLIELTSCLILPGIMTIFRIKFLDSFSVMWTVLFYTGMPKFKKLITS